MKQQKTATYWKLFQVNIFLEPFRQELKICTAWWLSHIRSQLVASIWVLIPRGIVSHVIFFLCSHGVPSRSSKWWQSCSFHFPINQAWVLVLSIVGVHLTFNHSIHHTHVHAQVNCFLYLSSPDARCMVPFVFLLCLTFMCMYHQRLESFFFGMRAVG